MSDKVNHQEVVQGLYEKKFKEKYKLAGRAAGHLKDKMLAASKKSKGEAAAIIAAGVEYIKEKGYKPDGGKAEKVEKPSKKDKAEKPTKSEKKSKKEKAKPVKKEKKAKPAKTSKKTKKEEDEDEDDEDSDEEEGAAEDDGTEEDYETGPKSRAKGAPKEKKAKSSGDPAAAILKKHGADDALKGEPESGIPKGNIDVRKLDRATLKGIAKDLGMGFSKETSDDDLRAAVSKAMIGMDKVAEKAIAAGDPAKVSSLKDCIGLYLDLNRAVCISCSLQKQCREIFDKNKEEGFSIFDQIKKEEVKSSKKFDPAREVECFDIGKVKDLEPVTLPEGEITNHKDYLAVIKEIKREVPSTLGEIRSIVLKHYDPDEDTKESKVKLTQRFVTYFEAIGLIKVS